MDTPVVLKLLSFVACAAAAEMGQWTVRSDAGREDLVQWAAALLPREQKDLERKLGLAMRGNASVVLCASTEGFRRATPGVDHRHTLGVADPADKVIYVNCEEIDKRLYYLPR